MEGKVTFVDENKLIIQIEGDTKSCESCGMKDNCTLPEKKTITLDKKLYGENFMENDLVDINMKPGMLTKLSFLVYIIPLFLMVFGGLVGSHFSENMSVLGGIIGLLCGIIFLIVMNKKISIKNVLTLKKL